MILSFAPTFFVSLSAIALCQGLSGITSTLSKKRLVRAVSSGPATLTILLSSFADVSVITILRPSNSVFKECLTGEF